MLDDRFEARRQNEAWRTWMSLGRPFVTYKVAITLDGRVTVPGARWVTGEESRRLVHELRAASDAVAVGMGTVRADAPRLDARDVPRRPPAAAARLRPRAAAAGVRARAALRARSTDELAALAAEGVQSLLLEGGPTLATAFLERRPRRQAARLPGADAVGRRAAVPRRARLAEAAVTSVAARVGERRAARGVPARALETDVGAVASGMFTGHRAGGGTVVASTGGDEGIALEIDAPADGAVIEVGGSVAINGVCLTAE